MAKQQRASAYYLDVIERKFPAIIVDYQAGKFSSVSAAAIAAGIKKPRTRLQELKNAWQKATLAEQVAFRKWLPPSTAPSPPVAVVPVSAVAINGRLEPWAVSRIQSIMTKRRMRCGEVMIELGFDPLNGSLGTAVSRGTRLAQDLIIALEGWLKTNAAV